MAPPFRGGRFLFNHYGTYLKGKFGGPVYKLMVDGGFTCPNRDGSKGSGGCIYCNNNAFTAGNMDGSLSVSEQVLSALEREEGKKRYGKAKYLVYFQKYSNTYGDLTTLAKLYRESFVSPRVSGIIIGTRPDCLTEEIVSLLTEISRERYVSVELGLQSISDEVLKNINRGHGIGEFRRAAELLRSSGIEVGAHLIYGLPGDFRENFLASGKVLAEEGISILKVTQIRVVRGTLLEMMWRGGEFVPPRYEEYLYALCDFIELLPPEIVLARLIGATPPGLLLAPDWSVGGGAFLEEVNRELARRGTRQGSRFELTL